VIHENWLSAFELDWVFVACDQVFEFALGTMITGPEGFICVKQ
jgi:hypothetical protein